MIDEQKKQKEYEVFMRQKMLAEMTEGNLRRMNRIKDFAKRCCCCCCGCCRKSAPTQPVQ